MCEDNTAEGIRFARLDRSIISEVLTDLITEGVITNFHGITNFPTIYLKSRV